MKKVFGIGFVILMVALLAVPSVQASPKQYFYVKASCPLNDLNTCKIEDASPPFEHLVGGQMLYSHHVDQINPAGIAIQIARVEMITESGNGMAIGQVRWIDDGGRFTFGQGSGSLAGFHATGKVAFEGVTPEGRLVFSLSGTYHIDPK